MNDTIKALDDFLRMTNPPEILAIKMELLAAIAKEFDDLMMKEYRNVSDERD